MSLELFDSSSLWGLLLALALTVAACVLFYFWRRPRSLALTVVLFVLLMTALAVQPSIEFLVQNSPEYSADYNKYRWRFLSPWTGLVVVIGGIAAVSTVALTAFATRQIQSAWRWATIVGLRCATVSVAFILFLQPAVELRQVAREPNHIAILVDDSESMELSDIPGQPNRREIARELLENSAASIAKWSDSHAIDVFTFADELQSSSLASVAVNKSAGKATLLRSALDQLRQRYQHDELAGIIVISDGGATGDLTEIGEGEFTTFVHEFGVPVHSVWTAQEGLKDVAVAEVHADEFAFVRTVTRFNAVIHSTGYKQRQVRVSLSSDGETVRTKLVTLEAGESTTPVFFEITPSHVGKYVYEISVPVTPDEVVAENNSSHFVLRVIRDKIRVLHVAGQPSWDVRALRSMLKQNPNVDLLSFFVLRTESDMRVAADDALSLIPFPTRELFEEELPSFDLVVLQNFNYAPFGLGNHLENIRSYVNNGGGLVMLGGPLSFASGQYGGTAIADVLPVHISSNQEHSSLIDSRTFRPKLTAQGYTHPITALRYDSNDNRKLWRTLPALEGINKILRAKKNATVLATHPTALDNNNNLMPVMIAGNFGKGRSLAITTDSLWRWGFVAAASTNNDGRHYLKFWENAIRWLIQDPELRYLHIDSDRNIYSPGDTGNLTIRLLDHDYSPLKNGKVTLTIRSGANPNHLEPVQTASVTVGQNGENSYQFTDLPPGVFRADASAMVRGKLAQAQDIFLVHESGVEMRRPNADSQILRMISTLSSGEFLANISKLPADLRFVPPKIVRVDKRSHVSLWNLPWLLLLALVFLGFEWGLRQRSSNL